LQAAFERLDLLAHRWLAQGKLIGGTCERAAACDRHEDAEFLEIENQ
jgi:hypothetical protein